MRPKATACLLASMLALAALAPHAARPDRVEATRVVAAPPTPPPPTPVPTPTPPPPTPPAAVQRPTSPPQPPRPPADPPAVRAAAARPPVELPAVDVRDRIAAAWPGDDTWAIRVTGCETGRTWNPAIVNRKGTRHGLWQFDLGTWNEAGSYMDPPKPKGSGWPASRESVEAQTARAWALFSDRRGGPRRWECK